MTIWFLRLKEENLSRGKKSPLATDAPGKEREGGREESFVKDISRAKLEGRNDLTRLSMEGGGGEVPSVHRL